jgi:hypothetical protein
LLALSLALVAGPKANGIFRYQPLNLKLTPARIMLSVKVTELFEAVAGASNPQFAEVFTGCVAKIDEEIFDLSSPIVSKGPLDACPGGPTIFSVALQ